MQVETTIQILATYLPLQESDYLHHVYHLYDSEGSESEPEEEKERRERLVRLHSKLKSVSQSQTVIPFTVSEHRLVHVGSSSFLWKSDCLGSVVLLCLIACMTCILFPSFVSLIKLCCCCMALLRSSSFLH